MSVYPYSRRRRRRRRRPVSFLAFVVVAVVAIVAMSSRPSWAQNTAQFEVCSDLVVPQIGASGILSAACLPSQKTYSVVVQNRLFPSPVCSAGSTETNYQVLMDCANGAVGHSNISALAWGASREFRVQATKSIENTVCSLLVAASFAAEQQVSNGGDNGGATVCQLCQNYLVHSIQQTCGSAEEESDCHNEDVFCRFGDGTWASSWVFWYMFVFLPIALIFWITYGFWLADSTVKWINYLQQIKARQADGLRDEQGRLVDPDSVQRQRALNQRLAAQKQDATASQIDAVEKRLAIDRQKMELLRQQRQLEEQRRMTAQQLSQLETGAGPSSVAPSLPASRAGARFHDDDDDDDDDDSDSSDDDFGGSTYLETRTFDDQRPEVLVLVTDDPVGGDVGLMTTDPSHDQSLIIREAVEDMIDDSGLLDSE